MSTLEVDPDRLWAGVRPEIVGLFPDRDDLTLERIWRGDVPAMLSRPLEAHTIVLEKAGRRSTGRATTVATRRTTWLMSDVLRTNELQVWFIAEHVVRRSARHGLTPATATIAT